MEYRNECADEGRLGMLKVKITKCPHLQANTTFIMARVWSALVFTLQSFVQTYITHITMERLVTVDSAEGIKQQTYLTVSQ